MEALSDGGAADHNGGSRALAGGLARAWGVAWGECHQPRPAALGRQAGAASCWLPGGCNQPASACEVHHVRHKANGGKTSTRECVLLCFFHHQVVIHRWGWTLVLSTTLPRCSVDLSPICNYPVKSIKIEQRYASGSYALCPVSTAKIR